MYSATLFISSTSQNIFYKNFGYLVILFFLFYNCYQSTFFVQNLSVQFHFLSIFFGFKLTIQSNSSLINNIT